MRINHSVKEGIYHTFLLSLPEYGKATLFFIQGSGLTSDRAEIGLGAEGRGAG